MKKWVCVLLVLAGLFVIWMISEDSPGNVFSMVTDFLSGEDDTPKELPALNGKFGGKTVSVKIAGKTVRVHQDLIDAMTAYEDFFDQYIEIISSDDVDAMEYASFMAKYAQTLEALEAMDENDMSEGDALYYLDVSTRINEKLLRAASAY